jgi:hypothetical protein
MDIQTYYTRSSQQLAFLFNKNQELTQSGKSNQAVNKTTPDTLVLSNEIQEVADLGLKLTNYNQTKDNSNYDFEYNFSNNLIQVQSSGNYDTIEKEGNLNLVLNLGKILNDKSKKISILPKEVKLEVNLSFAESSQTNDKVQIEDPPDMIGIITQLLKKINQVSKDSQNKELKSVFEAIKGVFDSSSNDGSKVYKELMNFIDSLKKNTQTQNNQKLEGVLPVSDKNLNITYNGQTMSLKLDNINLSFNITTSSQEA